MAVKSVRAWVHPFNGAARKACRPLTGLVCSTPVGWSDIWELTMLPYSSLCLNSTTIHLPSLEASSHPSPAWSGSLSRSCRNIYYLSFHRAPR